MIEQWRILRLAFFLSAAVFFCHDVFGQCCSQSCSLTSGAGAGLLENRHLEVTTFYKHSYSENYYSGREKYKFENAPLTLTNSFYDYGGISIGYGFTKNLTFEVQGGYFGNKTQNYENGAWIVGNGFSDVGATLKYNVYRSRDSVLSVTMLAGGKFPTGSYNDYTPEGVRLSHDVQSGTGAYSVTGGFLASVKIKKKQNVTISSVFEYCGINPEEYQSGYSNVNLVSTGIKLLKGLSLIVMFKNENYASDYYYDLKQYSTGYSRLSALPGIAFEFGNEWSLNAMYEQPLLRYFNGIQFVQQYGVTVSLSKKFELKKKKQVENDSLKQG